MDVIIIESEAYRDLVTKINSIAKFVIEKTSAQEINPDEEWVDGYEVCTFLNISNRTLQRMRTNGVISYSIISGKTYYTIAEIKRLLKERRIRTTEEAVQNLVDNHRAYAEQRRLAKANK
jgi:predicted nucleotidyltransferase